MATTPRGDPAPASAARLMAAAVRQNPATGRVAPSAATNGTEAAGDCVRAAANGSRQCLHWEEVVEYAPANDLLQAKALPPDESLTVLRPVVEEYSACAPHELT